MQRIMVFLFALILSAEVVWGAPILTDPGLSVRQVVAGLSAPTTMAFIGVNDFLVLQKNDGRVRRVTAGVLQSAAVLDLNVDGQSERGLLGIALHPNFPVTAFVYLYFSETSSDDGSGNGTANRVYRYSWDGSALAAPGTLIADLPISPGPNHDGGVIAFGPDGKLYIVIGDLNRNGQLQNNATGAPDDSSVILRLNDDGTVPGDNPFFAQGGNLAKYFAYGVRNSFGMAFDPVTGKLWNTENGPNNYDEVNLVEAGFNSGWRKLMGPDSRNANSVADLFAVSGAHYADPEFSWLAPVGVTAIAFPNSQLFSADYQNSALVGDVNNGNLYRLPLNQSRDGFFLSGGLADLVADSVAERESLRVGMEFNGITDLKLGPDGKVYVVSIGDGAVYVIEPGLSLGSAMPADGEVGVAYHAGLAVAGGTPPYFATLVKGTLPLGLALAGMNITGTPSQARQSVFTLKFDDAAGASASRSYRLKIVTAVAIATIRLPIGRVGRNFSAALIARGGKKTYSWSLVSGVLPAGLALDAVTGRIAGAPLVAASVNLTFRVTDVLGGAAQKEFVFTVK